MKKPKSKAELDFLAVPNRKAEKVRLMLLERPNLHLNAGGHMITSMKEIQTKHGMGIELMVDGKKITIVNPPMKVPDGTTYEEIADGGIVTRDNYEFNPRKALQEAVEQYFNSKK